MPKDRRKFRKIRASLFNEPWLIDERYMLQMIDALDQGKDAMQSVFADDEERSRTRIVNGAAIIPINGVIRRGVDSFVRWYGGTSSQLLERDFLRAMANPDVKQVIFLIDSPGGIAIGNEEVSKTIYDNRGKKPITAFVDGLCASAAYYLASAADKIIASPSATVGSIGTIYIHGEASKFYDEIGFKFTVITHGENKGDGNSVEPLTDRSRGNLQEWVNAYGNQFVAAVARNRGIKFEDVMRKFGQGKVFIADDAEQIGLVDSVGTIQGIINQVPARAEHDEEAEEVFVPGLAASASLAGPLAGIGDDDRPFPPQSIIRRVEQLEAARESARNHQEKESIVPPKVKAALFARGLITSMEASDDVAWAALTAFAVGRGRDDINQESDEKTVLAFLNGTEMVAAEALATVQPTNTVQAAHDREQAEAVADEENRAERNANLRSAARTLGISQEQLDEAIDSDSSFQETVSAWHEALAADEPPVSVEVTEASEDKFADQAACAMLSRAGYDLEEGQTAGDLENAPFVFLASEELRLRGRAPSRFARDEDVALEFLQLGGGGNVVINASAGGYNRPGDFPNLLSRFTNNILDQALQFAEVTYPTWTDRLADLPDFKIKDIIGTGHFEELDLIMDGDDVGELQMNEEHQSWISIDRYGDAIKLTPVMIVNDDMDGFATQLRTLAMAHEFTLNRMCVDLLAGSTTMSDGVALFHANHNNLIASGGGAPSVPQHSSMREKHWSQTGINGTTKLRTQPKFALVPTGFATEAEQTYLPQQGFSPALDSNTNPFRNKVRPVVEPVLDEYSTTEWYTICDPKVRRVIVHAFQRGYSRNGRRTSWFDPKSECRWVKLEGRFAAAAASFRGAVKNPGA